jgi:predicted Zn-dependent protease
MPTDTTGLSLYDYAIDRFSTAFVAIAKGNTDTANLELAQLKARIDAAKVLSVEEGLHGDDSATSEDDFLLATIIAREIEALLAFRNGDTDQAIRIMASAVEDENARPLYYGPPHVPKPSNELLGEMLLTLGRPDEAITQFQISLGQNTSKSQSLLGLARAQKAVGDNAATQTWQQVESNWRGDINTIRNLEYTWLASIASSAAPSGD